MSVDFIITEPIIVQITVTVSRYPCGSAAYNGCSDDELGIFMNISIIRGEYESLAVQLTMDVVIMH